MFSASAQTIPKVQLVTGIASLLGLFYFDCTALNTVILIVSFYVYSIIGISLTFHRYYSHHSFEFKHKAVKWICTLLAILSGRGSPIGWVYVHRLHHTYADTEKDPHSPKLLGFKLFGFKHVEKHLGGDMKYFLVKDLMDPIQLKINKYYFLIILTFVLALGMIDVSLLYFVWILPVFLIQLSQKAFNYYSHISGYKNFDTRDDSTNNIWLWPFIWGDAWHNNHHANAGVLSTKVRKYEFDPVVVLANLIKR
jgi:stearoyl-CoA desaturase (delta-9 desaturase)